jgi:L-fucose mutarotase/ribose pyranase (RbsD/FucU family)
MISIDSRKLLEYLGEHIDYKDKVLVIPKNKEVEDFIRKQYPTPEALNKVRDYNIYEKSRKIFVVTSPEKIREVFTNFPTTLFDIYIEAHPEFV